jgi:hypothetical protein
MKFQRAAGCCCRRWIIDYRTLTGTYFLRLSYALILVLLSWKWLFFDKIINDSCEYSWLMSVEYTWRRGTAGLGIDSKLSYGTNYSSLAPVHLLALEGLVMVGLKFSAWFNGDIANDN